MKLCLNFRLILRVLRAFAVQNFVSAFQGEALFGRKSDEPAGIEEVFFPVGVAEAVDPHRLAGARGVDEFVLSYVDAHVGIRFSPLVEKKQVAFAHLSGKYRPR